MFRGVLIGICWSLPLIPPLCTRPCVVDELSPAGAVEESQALGQHRLSEHPSAPSGVTVPWRSGPRVAGGWLQVCGCPPGPPLRPARCTPPRLSAQQTKAPHLVCGRAGLTAAAVALPQTPVPWQLLLAPLALGSLSLPSCTPAQTVLLFSASPIFVI